MLSPVFIYKKISKTYRNKASNLVIILPILTIDAWIVPIQFVKVPLFFKSYPV